MPLTRQPSDVHPDVGRGASALSPPALGLAVALALMVAAMVVPAAAGWDVRIGFPPLFAHWMPRVGPGTAAAVAIASLGVVYGDLAALRLSWPRLLAVAWIASLGWLISLALVDGRSGLSSQVDTDDFLQ